MLESQKSDHTYGLDNRTGNTVSWILLGVEKPISYIPFNISSGLQNKAWKPNMK